MSHILVVDDDPDILRVLAAGFECAGHRVRATLDPDEVGPLLGQHRFDLLVLDVMMPRRSGWEILEDLRRDPRTERLPVMMLSAIGDSTNRARGIRLGADDFLAKPFDPEELIARVEGLLMRRGAAAGSLQGDFVTFPVGELLQAFQNNAATGVLEASTPGAEYRLRLQDGHGTAAACGQLTGAEAVLALLGERVGTFSFHRDAPRDSRESEGTALPPISQLLLESAWIEDELQARRAFLPPIDRGLVVTGVAGSLPAGQGLPEIPAAEVLSLAAARPGISLQEILARTPVSPNRVRLAVAWLIASGWVQEGKPDAALAGPALEELDELLAELAQESALRGFPADRVEVAVLVDPSARSAAARLIAGLPLPPRNGAGWPTLSGAFSVLRPRGELRLHVHPFADDLADAPWLRSAAALVFWLGDEPAAEATRAAAAVDRLADPRAYRLAITRGGASPAAGRVRLLREEPQGLSDLLGAILSPLVEIG
jgi:DNA-binding response OmpR family regulator